MTMQDKIISELCCLARAAGLDPVAHRDFANTGHLYIQQAFATVLDVAYDFQGEYCTLSYAGRLAGVYMNSGTWQPGPDGVVVHGRLTTLMRYADPSGVQHQLAMFTAMLQPAGAGQRMTPGRAWQAVSAAIPVTAVSSTVQEALAVLAGVACPGANPSPAGSVAGTAASESTGPYCAESLLREIARMDPDAADYEETLRTLIGQAQAVLQAAAGNQEHTAAAPAAGEAPGLYGPAALEGLLTVQGTRDAGAGTPGEAAAVPQDDPADLIRVRVRWTEIITSEAARDLDAARIRRLGYDPQDPHSIARYLKAADGLSGDDWYPWHSEFSEDARRLDADGAEISEVTLET